MFQLFQFHLFHVRSSLIPFTLLNVAQTWLINHFDARANALKEKKVQSSDAECEVYGLDFRTRLEK